MFILIILFLLMQPCYAEESLSTKDILFDLLTGKEDYKTVDSAKIKQDLEKEFGIKDEDMTFISSIRVARLPYDGFDFFRNPKELVQLCTLYLEAKHSWGKDITDAFYDFFAEYASNRITIMGKGRIVQYYKDFYQTDEAKKRFKLPN